MNPSTGDLAEIPGAPFPLGGTAAGSLGLAVSGTAAQSVSGPAVQLFPTSIDFGQTTAGQTTGTKIVSLVNTGNQLLAINGISITGTAAGDFCAKHYVRLDFGCKRELLH